jgi:hypothetical protein
MDVSATLPTDENPSTYCIQGWAVLREIVDIFGEEKNLLPLLWFEPQSSKFI